MTQNVPFFNYIYVVSLALKRWPSYCFVWICTTHKNVEKGGKMRSTKVVFGILAMAASVVAGSNARASQAEVEVKVEEAFAPMRGFDDNDNVQVVIHGMLPNACYTLGRHELQRESGNSYRIRQFAIKREDGVCMQDGPMPPHMQLAIPFTTEVSIGQLQVGDYSFDYDKQGQNPGNNSIAVNVERSKAPTIDSLPYASVSSMSIPDVVDSRENTVVTVEGVLTSSCMELNPSQVKIQQIKDVYVVLPIVTIKTGVMCAQQIKPFRMPLQLGKLAEGHYLIHVRSMNGKAVNRVVESLIPIRSH